MDVNVSIYMCACCTYANVRVVFLRLCPPLSFLVGWLERLQGSSCLAFPALGLQVYITTLEIFMCILGLECRFLCLDGKLFTDWAISLTLVSLFYELNGCYCMVLVMLATAPGGNEKLRWFSKTQWWLPCKDGCAQGGHCPDSVVSKHPTWQSPQSHTARTTWNCSQWCPSTYIPQSTP